MYSLLDFGCVVWLLFKKTQVQKVSDYQNGSKEKYSKPLSFVIIILPLEIEWIYKAVEASIGLQKYHILKIQVLLNN